MKYTFINDDGEVEKYSSLYKAQEILEIRGGYDYLTSPDTFDNYECAWINQWNIIGRHCSSYYFSMKHKGWHKVVHKVTDCQSWFFAKQPFKIVALFFLDLLGYKKKQEQELRKWEQKMQIDRLFNK